MEEQEQCRLFKLPAELRNTIYELCLVPAPENALTNKSGSPQPQPTASTMDAFPLLQATRLSPKVNKHLLYTCKKIAHEAHGIYISAYRNYWRNSIFTITTERTSKYPRQAPLSARKLRKQLATVKAGDYANIKRLHLVVEAGPGFEYDISLNWAGPGTRSSEVVLNNSSRYGVVESFALTRIRNIFSLTEMQMQGGFNAKEALISILERLG